jgi:gamma-glutamyltranspeptidase/glutathione hydrolase
VHDLASKKTEMLDFIGPASAAVSPRSDRPTAIPAMPRGLFALHAKYGSLRWEALIGPAEQLARIGNPVSRTFARQLALVAEPLMADPETRRVFAASGQMPNEGMLLAQLDLAATLARLRGRGVGDFYGGASAQELVNAVNRAGGSLSVEELRAFTPQWRPALSVPFGDWVAHFSAPPAAAGLVEAQAWNALVRDGAWRRAAEADRPHLLAETLSRVYASRARWMAPDGSAREPVPPLLTEAAAKALLADYRPGEHVTVAGMPNGNPDVPSGTGFVVADRNGQAVACALTMNNLFGTGRIAPETGMLLAAAPGDRGRGPQPLGPMMITNRHLQDLRFAAAGGGGLLAPASVLATALDAFVDEKPLDQALARKRLHHGATPDALALERGSPWAADLARRGHRVVEVDWPALVQALHCPDAVRAGKCSVGTDPRGSGLAVTAGN